MMRRCKLHLLRFTAAYCLLSVKVNAQKTTADSDFIQSFSKPNVIELYSGIYSTDFNFTTPGKRKTDYRLAANSSAYVGLYVNYKWVSLKYSWAMPGTELDKNIRLNYTSLSIRLSSRQMAFHPFYESYNGLLIPVKEPGLRYKPFRGIQFTNAGTDIYYYTNSKKFSFHAANYFSDMQLKSVGSLIVMTTPMWEKIKWNNPSYSIIGDTGTFNLLAANPQWISLIGRIGFTYNFVFQKGKWSIAPAFLAGGGAIKEIQHQKHQAKLVTDVQAWVNAGFNGPEFYFYTNASRNNLQTNLFIKNLHQVKGNFSITAGYRFQSMKKKVFKII